MEPKVTKQNKVNYQLLTENMLKVVEKLDKKPKLLLHSCCAPCSCYVMEYLASYFELGVYFYNPNIYPKKEYEKRLETQKKYNDIFDKQALEKNYNPVKFIEGAYEPSVFYERTKDFAHHKEGGKRCHICYDLRLEQTAKTAKELGYDYFTSCLSISPHKQAEPINKIGEKLEKKLNIRYLYADFKKRGGFNRSLEICKTCKLYRQDYCGCVYSLLESKIRQNKYSVAIEEKVKARLKARQELVKEVVDETI